MDVSNINFVTMRFILLLLIFVLCSSKTFSQENLVRNPSFEMYNRLPLYIGDAPGCIKDWTFAGERGSGDYYNTLASGAYHVPENTFGNEAPHSGNGYAGFCVTSDYREFLRSSLTSKLVKGQKYRFTMYISKGDDEDVSYLKEISVMFLSRPIELRDDLVMVWPPQLVFYQENGFTQNKGWQELTMEFIAKGTEQWIYIGAHQWKCDTCTVPETPRKTNPGIFGGDPGEPHAHYYVDDVSIVPVNETVAAVDTVADFVPGQTYSYSNIHFENNSAVLESNTQPDLEKVLAYMKQHPEYIVNITGHTDSIGAEADNLKLSIARAEAVKKYLVDHGIEQSRIRVNGLGETQPANSNSTPEGRALNRRVEFRFTLPDENKGK